MTQHQHTPHKNNPGHAGGRHVPGVAPEAGGAQAMAGRRLIPGWLFGSIMLLWWIGGYGAVIYSVLEDQGPFTFLLSWQTALFGGSNIVLAAGVGAVVIFLGPPLVTRALRRFWPGSAVIADLDQQMRRSARSRREIAADVRQQWDQATREEKVRIARRTRNIGLVLAAAALLIAFTVSVWVRVTANADAGQPLTPVAVSRDGPIMLGKASAWVHITAGAPRLDTVLAWDYTIRGYQFRDYYTPILPPDWRKGDRVYLLEKDVTTRGEHDAENSADPAGPMEGKLSLTGPRDDVTSTFQSYGYNVGPWTAVLRRNLDLGGKIPGEADGLDFLFWLEGGVFGLVGLVVAFNQQRRLRRILAQKA
ncbi:MAG: hypothetical protein POG74_11945 [Acidocella sp.]|nr:hypothetical protein [Acidocella sp.]